MGTENTQSHNEKRQSIDEASVAATTSQNNGKGKLLPEIGMGIVGIIVAYLLSVVVRTALYFALIYNNFLFILDPLFTIPLVAEGVLFAGKHTGGHEKRKGCYIGAVIGEAIGAVLVFIYLKTQEESTSFEISFIGLTLVCVTLVLILGGAIIGYRKDAA